MDGLPLCHYTADSLSGPPALTVPMPCLFPHDGGPTEAAAQKGRQYGMDSEEWSQWQSEFRGQIRALRHWLKTMEKRLPPPDPDVSLSHTLQPNHLRTLLKMLQM
ncbi:hypothetical protein Q8A67_008210 [Cirrhinus molitorella]|uniref:Uncharacterized protein n=1 Tax=Cirrhinus molitorella TaxID=172907 RepID=A0AA88PWX0_9TELE|nr:hypothetical protein Q8A67_008210 [Cirrhinus molitorella]